ncbi:hypothetical protein EDB85DRAFT_1364294 [Lactarius pseudohatsudake]|nr:hypothetical protein EDB85DRAFT_1364294 [Lactarius pseudohatsudake]
MPAFLPIDKPTKGSVFLCLILLFHALVLHATSSPSSVFLNWNATGPKPPIAAVAWLSNIFKDGIARSGVLNYGARLSDEER